MSDLLSPGAAGMHKTTGNVSSMPWQRHGTDGYPTAWKCTREVGEMPPHGAPGFPVVDGVCGYLVPERSLPGRHTGISKSSQQPR